MAKITEPVVRLLLPSHKKLENFGNTLDNGSSFRYKRLHRAELNIGIKVPARAFSEEAVLRHGSLGFLRANTVRAISAPIDRLPAARIKRSNPEDFHRSKQRSRRFFVTLAVNSLRSRYDRLDKTGHEPKHSARFCVFFAIGRVRAAGHAGPINARRRAQEGCAARSASAGQASSK